MHNDRDEECQTAQDKVPALRDGDELAGEPRSAVLLDAKNPARARFGDGRGLGKRPADQGAAERGFDGRLIHDVH